MSESFSGIAFEPDEAKAVALKAYQAALAILRGGEPVVLTAEPAQHPVEIAQRKFLHGPVLGQIAAQVKIPQADGKVQRYTIDTWKEHFRRRFVGENGYRWDLQRIPRWDAELGRLVQPARATPHRIRISTEELGRRAYAKFIDEIIDHATDELGVVFVFTREEQALREQAQPRRRTTVQAPT